MGCLRSNSNLHLDTALGENGEKLLRGSHPSVIQVGMAEVSTLRGEGDAAIVEPCLKMVAVLLQYVTKML